MPTLTDLPIRACLEDYAACRESVREAVERHPDSIAAYAAGEVRHPGHSDLDIFVVLSDDAEIRPFLGPSDLPEPGPTLANHSFPHYPRRIFQEIHYLFPLFSPLDPLIEKEPVNLEPPPDEDMEARRLKAFYVVDYLFKKVFRLLEQTPEGPVPARTLLNGGVPESSRAWRARPGFSAVQLLRGCRVLP